LKQQQQQQQISSKINM